MTEMQAQRWTWRRGGLLLAGAILAAAVAIPSAQAQEEDNLPDAWLFRQVLQGLGLRGNDVGIDYRERSPLVVPPALTLPPPETASVADRNAQWPVDQDVKRQREAAAARTKTRFIDINDVARPLSEKDLTPGPRTRPPAGSVSGPTDDTRPGTPLSPNALGYVGGLFDSMFNSDKPEYKPFTGEPPRTALVEPPAGYRTPAPSQPYGIGKRSVQEVVYDPLTNQNLVRDRPQ